MSPATNHHLFPKQGKIADALLILLYEQGGKGHALRAADAYEPLADFFNLNNRARSITRAEYLHDGRNTPYWHIRVHAARERLVKRGDLHRHAGYAFWKLTQQGR